jgi:hypothetical protein
MYRQDREGCHRARQANEDRQPDTGAGHSTFRLPVALEKFLAVSPPGDSHDPGVSHLQMPLTS